MRTDKCSPNTKTPIKTAVTGSKAPKIADKVGPISFMAIVMVSKDIMVGIHDACANASQTYGFGYNLVAGANIAGFLKVADAMMAQGLV